MNLTSYSIREHVYGDEQSAFDCNTKETGCPNACYSGKYFTAVNFGIRGIPPLNKVNVQRTGTEIQEFIMIFPGFSTSKV